MSLVFEIQDFTAKAGQLTHEVSEMLIKDQVRINPDETIPKWDWPQLPKWKRRGMSYILDKVRDIDTLLLDIYSEAEDMSILEDYLPMLEKYIEDGIKAEPVEGASIGNEVGEFWFDFKECDEELDVEEDTAMECIPFIAEMRSDWVFETDGMSCFVMTREYAKANNIDVREDSNFTFK